MICRLLLDLFACGFGLLPNLGAGIVAHPFQGGQGVLGALAGESQELDCQQAYRILLMFKLPDQLRE